MSKYTFHNDPGHGWLEVPRAELVELGIDKAISSYSYQKGDKVFLEEDSDVTAFIHARKASGKEMNFDKDVVTKTYDKAWGGRDTYASYSPDMALVQSGPIVAKVFDLGDSSLAKQNGITHMAEGPSKAEAFGLTPDGEIKKFGHGASKILARLDNAGGALSKAAIDAGSDGLKALYNVAASAKVRSLVQSAGKSAFNKLEHGEAFTLVGINGSADQGGFAYKQSLPQHRTKADINFTVQGMDPNERHYFPDSNAMSHRVLMTPEGAKAWEAAMQGFADKSGLTVAEYKTANAPLNDQVLAASAVVKGVPTPFDPETGKAGIDMGRAGKLGVELNGGDMLDVSFSKGGVEFARKENLVSINQVQPTVGGVMGGRAQVNELLIGLIEATVEGKTRASEQAKTVVAEKTAAKEVADVKPVREKAASQDKGR